MRAFRDRHEELAAGLRRLEQYPTVSPFSRLFYRLVNELLQSVDDKRLTQAFILFLRCETRRHKAVSRIVRRGKADLVEIIQTGRKSAEVLDTLKKQLERMELSGREEAIARELILAECNYHLGHTKEVIERLRLAVESGSTHPLVHFALGYNLYVNAMQEHTKIGTRKNEVIANDPIAFVGACRDALTAFRAGLGDPSYDAQIYWWIGLIHEMLGERRDAREAYRSAMETDPDNFTDTATSKIDKLQGRIPQRSAKEKERLEQLGPISDEEIEGIGDFLDVINDFPFD